LSASKQEWARVKGVAVACGDATCRQRTMAQAGRANRSAHQGLHKDTTSSRTHVEGKDGILACLAGLASSIHRVYTHALNILQMVGTTRAPTPPFNYTDAVIGEKHHSQTASVNSHSQHLSCEITRALSCKEQSLVHVLWPPPRISFLSQGGSTIPHSNDVAWH
jgi:hypothetical protein